ncbi:MAG: alkaline phosphatase, partial [Bacteroidales bacterium]|nr:alkaline phosphatase [Bacteroidales bacterium]
MRRINHAVLMAFVLTTIFVFSSCQSQNINHRKAPVDQQQAKYIFYFIGDGMGLSQVHLTEGFLAAREGKVGVGHLNMTSLPHTGIAKTYAGTRFITGSAAAGTALATGQKTSINTIAMTSDKITPLKSIASKAKEVGMKVGIISSVNINHATPAVFYAHQPERSMYYEIGLDLAKSDFDYFGGGGIQHPKGKNGDADIDALELAKKNGFQYVDVKEDFESLKSGNGKVIAVNPVLLESMEMPYGIDQDDSEISLAEFTAKGIELLDNENGFFMMVEGGKIDWACHSNDAATVIHEVLEFDNAIGQALEFYKKHPNETLIVVTADHETGGLTLGYGGTHYDSYLEKLQYQTVSYDQFSKAINEYKSTHRPQQIDPSFINKMIMDQFGLGNDTLGLEITSEERAMIREAFMFSMPLHKTHNLTEDEMYLKYGGGEPLAATVLKILSHRAGISWTSHSHTALPAPVFSIGVGAQMLDGYMENTDIPLVMEK